MSISITQKALTRHLIRLKSLLGALSVKKNKLNI